MATKLAKNAPIAKSPAIEDLADEYGSVSREIRALEKRQEYLKKQIIETNKMELVGNQYVVRLATRQRSRFIQAKAEEYLTPEQYESCLGTTVYTQLDVVSRENFEK